MAIIKQDYGTIGKNTFPYIQLTPGGAGEKYTISSATASSTYSSGFEVDKSYDGRNSTAWMPTTSGSNVPYNVVYDLGSSKYIDHFYLQFATSDGSAYAITLKIEVSTDGTNYTEIIPTTQQFNVTNAWNNQGGGTVPTQCVYVYLFGTYRYVKINFVRYSGTASYCPGIGEISFFNEIL